MMCNVTYNSELNGIELRFPGKPDQSVLDLIKSNGYKWSMKQKMWYARQNEKTASVASQLSGQPFDMPSAEREAPALFDLWAMTRTDSIGNNVDKALTAKEIAAICRKHIKERFPMCRISLTVHHRDDLDVSIKAAPFAHKSEELEAIREYINAYIDSFQYGDDDDPYADYHWHNFYGGNCDTWYCEQTAQTEEVLDMIQRFKVSKAAFERAEAERQIREAQEAAERRKVEEAEAARRRQIEEAQHNEVEAAAVVRDVEYFVENAVFPKDNKCCYLCAYVDSVKENGAYKSRACRVTREVHLTKAHFDILASNLLDDWSFVAGMGGTATDDCRINSMMDYNNMTSEERETVEWYENQCVAIFCDGEMKLIVNPEGYGYCRYVYLVGDETRVVNSHSSEQVVSAEEHEADVAAADALEDTSAEVIEMNGLIASWDTDNFAAYKEAMKRKIYGENGKPGITFGVNVVRALPEEMSRLKTAMYKLLEDLNSTQEQFTRANIQPGQRITIVKMQDFGGISVMRVTVNSWRKTTYAQYRDVVELIYTPSRSRTQRKIWLYNDFLVYDGWLGDLPENLTWETVSEGGGVVVRRMRHSSFDRAWYDDAIAHYESCGRKPIVNTYQPPFMKDSRN